MEPLKPTNSGKSCLSDTLEASIFRFTMAESLRLRSRNTRWRRSIISGRHSRWVTEGKNWMDRKFRIKRRGKKGGWVNFKGKKKKRKNDERTDLEERFEGN